MGINIHGLRLLVEAWARHGDFGDVLQLGRQGMVVPDEELPVACKLFSMKGLGDYRERVGTTAWADERLLPALGARRMVAADASPFEGARFVHDFNEPIPVETHQTFDTVLDGGALEHIFNVPVALANLMNALRVGGRLIFINAANDQLGHGFYQFGPDFAFRVFGAANGFSASVFLAPRNALPRLIRLQDVGAAGRRQEIGRTGVATYLMVIAVKQEHVVPFRRWPQQGDYAATWSRFRARDQRRADETPIPPRAQQQPEN